MTRRWVLKVLMMAEGLALAAWITACGGRPAQPPATPTMLAPLPPTVTAVAPQPVPTRTASLTPPPATATAYPTPTPTLASAETPTADQAASDPTVYLPMVTSDGATPAAAAHFAVGAGGSDVIPHQIVRTDDNRLYIFVFQQYSAVLRVYWTTTAGMPASAAAFAGSAQLSAPGNPLTLDAAYDGGHIVHVLINVNASGTVYDYPFDTTANTFGSGISLATDAHTVSGDYLGSSGVAGMVDQNGLLHVAYWSSGNHIMHKAYAYAGGALTQAGSSQQVDTGGSANHPAVAVSPADNSLTVAWVSQATTPAAILVRTRTGAGAWGAVTKVSTAGVWTGAPPQQPGYNIDQGPSLLIGSDGTKHLTYIEQYDSSGDYGHVHYVTNGSGSWTDSALTSYSHDPALALNSKGELYIIGHGHPKSQNTACLSVDDMCTIKKNANDTWGAQQLFAAHTATASFDGSSSVKWSAVGFNHPENIEFVFFAVKQGDYSHPTIYYGRF